MERVKVKLLNENAVMPTYGSEGAAGFDLYAAEDVIIEPGQTKKVPLGLAFELPPGYVLYIMPRSGISYETKLRQPNSVGVIDSDYRGEVAMMFDNISQDTWSNAAKGVDGMPDHSTTDKYESGSYIIRKGDRVCQGVIQKLPKIELVQVDRLSETKRGAGGFGSTGVHG
ncbi:deoxyuridine 5'-triphosphate nucleotidohydrolase [Shouchella clausii KSM-K16]|uniref:dUTP diphosphatase n=1 Tax=Shouchella clausii (strain KSM-K16) TaxID=66692 RepID=Q5WE29_SHOC1|nr:dUTP diphosphatase [Shouchella clausii]BAD65381.1 deoxyuridine 5'-triphosphate nucleotidohydrolase [Shouchella clausii KSM-K16]